MVSRNFLSSVTVSCHQCGMQWGLSSSETTHSVPDCWKREEYVHLLLQYPADLICWGALTIQPNQLSKATSNCYLIWGWDFQSRNLKRDHSSEKHLQRQDSSVLQSSLFIVSVGIIFPLSPPQRECRGLEIKIRDELFESYSGAVLSETVSSCLGNSEVYWFNLFRPSPQKGIVPPRYGHAAINWEDVTTTWLF